MQKIFNYILKGQGLGVKFLILLALVMSLVIATVVKVKGNDFVPYAQQVADQMLPIKIENGVVVRPYNTFKQASIQLNDYSSPFYIPFVIDTSVDTFDASDLKPGVYMSRTAFYTVQRNEVRMLRLEGNVEILKADYTEVFKSWMTWFAVIFGIISIFFLFILYFILALFYSLCAKVITWMTSVNLDFDQRMRLSSVALITAYILFLPFDWGSVGTNKLLFFIVMIALQIFAVKKIQGQGTAPAPKPIEEKSEHEVSAIKAPKPVKKTTAKEAHKEAVTEPKKEAQKTSDNEEKKPAKKAAKVKKAAKTSAKKEAAKPAKKAAAKPAKKEK